MNFRVIYVIFRKEILEIFRDKRALFISFFIPIFLPPICFLVLDYQMQKSKAESEKPIVIYMENCDSRTKTNLTRNGIFINQNVTHPLLSLGKKRIYAILECIKNTAGQTTYEITIDNKDLTSIGAYERIQKILISQKFKESELVSNTENRIVLITMHEQSSAAGSILISLIAPILLFLFAALSTMIIASDLFSGEKERSTLEHLISQPISRSEIILGKYFTIVLMGIVGVIAYCLGLFLTFFIAPDALKTGDMLFSFQKETYITGILIGLILVFFFASVFLLISTVASSIKEAQLLSIPIIIFSVIASQVGNSLSSDFYTIAHFIPILNLSYSFREFILERYNFFILSFSFLGSVIVTISILKGTIFLARLDKFVVKK